MQREESYFRATNDSVTFAVAAYGTDGSHAGLCYRISSSQASQDVIAQVFLFHFAILYMKFMCCAVRLSAAARRIASILCLVPAAWAIWTHA